MNSKILTSILALLTVNLFAQSGAIDTTFGSDGSVFTTINNSGMASGIAIQSDGKIIAVGTATFNSGNAFVAVRYTTNGYLDATFGNYGILSTRIGPWSAANCVLVQPDGKIVLAGKSINLSGDFDFTLVRFNTDGSLDSTFGVEGIEISDLGGDDEVTSLNIQADGKLVATGFSNTSDSSSNIAIVRYTTSGNLDGAFGNSGITLTPVSLSSLAPAPLQKPDCKLQSDGKVVVVTTGFYETDDIIILRYNADGSPDNSFGNSGQVRTDFGSYNDYGYALCIQPDGKIIAGGGSVNPATDSDYMALVRYNSDGSIDKTFGTSGKINAIPVLGGGVDVRSLVMQTNGNIIAAGTEISASLVATQEFIIAKYSPNGSLNDSFGTGGYTITGFTNSGIVGNAIALQAGEKIIMAGGNNQDFILTRLLNNPDSIALIDTTDTVPTYIMSERARNSNGLIVYPNPTNNEITLQYDLLSDDNVTVRLWDATGQIVAMILHDAVRLPGTQKENINVAALPAGYYLLTYSSSKGQSAIPFLKE